MKFKVERLFALACFLKLGLAVSSYFLNQPIWLGMVLPLVVMVLYIALGHFKREHGVSDEKFADSCYYLGFLFTIASIILCLFDVPKMADGAGLFEIAVRFGAAMISTLLGMAVRVYLVSFTKDTEGAMKAVEVSLIDASRGFTLQLNDTTQQLKALEVQIIDAAKNSVASVQMQMEALARGFSDSFSQFYDQLTEDTRASMAEALSSIQIASGRLAAVMDKYSEGLQVHLGEVKSSVEAFVDGIEQRLETTSFPDDVLVRELREPLNKLREETASLGAGVEQVVTRVERSGEELDGILAAIGSKAGSVGSAVEALVAMSDEQRKTQAGIAQNTDVLSRIAARLEDLQVALQVAADSTNQNHENVTGLASRLQAIFAEGETLKHGISLAVDALNRGAVASAEQQTLLAQATAAITGMADRTNEQAADLNRSLQSIAQALTAKSVPIPYRADVAPAGGVQAVPGAEREQQLAMGEPPLPRQ
jgi:hypothetical protein